MRVLVTGVTGQVGGEIVKALASNASVVAADRQRLDLAQPDRIAPVLDRIAPDLIINPAAYTAVDRAQDERDMAYRINAEAPGTIARWAASRRIPMIHFSTDYVFDGSGTEPWREDDETKPLSVYGASKLAGEKAVQSAGGLHLIIRTSWVYAASGERNFLQTISKLAAERRELRIVADQVGAPTSAYFIAEVVAAIIDQPGRSLVDRFADVGGIINVAATGQTSWHGFAVAIVSGLKARGKSLIVENIIPISTEQYPVPAARPANSRLDLSHLNESFGIRPPTWESLLTAELDKLVGPTRKSDGSSGE